MNEKFYPQIEDFNLGKLAKPELEKFEAAMADDAALKNAVAENRLEWEARELMAEQILRAQVRQKFVDQPPETGGFFQKNWKWLVPAALFLGLAGFFLFQKKASKPPETVPPSEVLPEKKPAEKVPIAEVKTPETLPEKPAPPKIEPKVGPKTPRARQLAMAAYQPPEGLTGVRGIEDGDAMTLAGRAFSGKNYKKTAELLAELPEEGRQEALSLRAHAFFGMGKYAEAARDFQELEAGGVYRREAGWFGILAKMAVPGADLNALKPLLEKIGAQPKHPYQKNAEAILGEMR